MGEEPLMGEEPSAMIEESPEPPPQAASTVSAEAHSRAIAL